MTSSPPDHDTGLILTGLDGSNPLAFLAALGTLRTLSYAWPDREVKMAWVEHDVAWRPMICATASTIVDRTEYRSIVLKAIMSHLARSIDDHPICFLSELSRLAPHTVRPFFLERVNTSTLGDHHVMEWLSAISSDLAPDATSQLQTTRRDYFFGNLQSIIARTEQNHLNRCLFTPWDYADALDNQSLHFDPTEDRRHAYQWDQPSGDPSRKKWGGMLGANRLAIEAFPFFQSIASDDKLSTRGFSGNRANNTRWTWPIWSRPLGHHEVCSTLSLHALQDSLPDARSLRSRGIAAVYRSRRILVGKTPNFTPATAVF